MKEVKKNTLRVFGWIVLKDVFGIMIRQRRAGTHEPHEWNSQAIPWSRNPEYALLLVGELAEIDDFRCRKCERGVNHQIHNLLGRWAMKANLRGRPKAPLQEI